MTLKTNSTFNGIPVCSKCGWTMVGPYEEERHRACPHVAAGNLATQLASRFPELPSTKFGYGSQMLTFELDARAHLSFACSDERFRMDRAWLPDGLTPDEAAGLVEAISSWRVACLHRRHASKDRLSNDAIIDVRDSLLAKGSPGELSVRDQNLLRDCEITLGVVRCRPESREEARDRVARTLKECV